MQLLEKHIKTGKQVTGRTGMDLWSIFVLAQVRLCLNLTYNNLHNYICQVINYHHKDKKNSLKTNLSARLTKQ